jgi:lia operon protein LiaG
MKQIKAILILAAIMISSGNISAQEYKVTVQNSKETKLIIKDFSNDLPIEGYSGNEIIITSISGETAPPEKAKGLKAIYPGGSDNSGIGVNAEKSGNNITITCLVPFTRHAEYKMKIPDNLAIQLESGCERSSDVTISNMKNELDIQNCHDITLKGVTGPLVLSSIAGDISIDFSSIASDKPFSVNSVSGDIDITLPAKTAANLELGTINGSFYSDFDLSISEKDLKKVGGSQMKFALNGGGFKFSIVTVNGNIFLRKGNQ